MIGTGYPNTNARAMNHSVLAMALGRSGSARTRRKFSRPTHVGSDTRLVSWTLITKPRRIGYQANTPNTSRNGSRKTSVLRPSRVMRRRRVRGRLLALVTGAASLMVPIGSDRLTPAAPGVGRTTPPPALG